MPVLWSDKVSERLNITVKLRFLDVEGDISNYKRNNTHILQNINSGINLRRNENSLK